MALLEAGGDVGAATSKANTALLHTGFDAKPGTLEAQLVRRGHELLGAYAPRAGIPLEHVGALLVAWSEQEQERFPAIVERAHANGYDAIRELAREELLPPGPASRAGRAGGVGGTRRGHRVRLHYPAGVRHRGGARTAASYGSAAT